MKSKTWKFFIIIPILGLIMFLLFQVLIGIYVIIPWAVPWVGEIVIANPPRPKITYGEFPFQLTYELNGEKKVVEDTVICEFVGFELRGTAGKYREWKTHLKSGNDRVVLLALSEMDETDMEEYENLEFYYSFGNAEYYMSDPDKNAVREPNNGARTLDYIKWSSEKKASSAISAEEAQEKYNLKIIALEHAPPIQNSFK